MIVAYLGMPANPDKISISMELIQTFRILTALTIGMFWGIWLLYSAHCGIDSYLHGIERLQWYDGAFTKSILKHTLKILD